jgi:2-oxoglutarate ferredoxin oxidoreductase subunit alpha
MNTSAQNTLIHRLKDKILKNADKIIELEEEHMEDADIVLVSYGITSRVAERAYALAREKGLKVGKMRMITVWPFPEKHVRELASKVKAFVVPEINMGQMVREVERAAAGLTRTISVPHAGGSVHRPEQILEAIEEAAK